MEECLICEGKNLKIIKTKVSEFLAERMFGKADINTDLIFCKDCGFAFYTLRPDKEQTNQFYKGYRNSDYQKQRQKYDCWYTPQLNEIIGKHPIEVENKKKRLSKILNQYIDLSKIKSVLDYGGDKGQNFPDEFKDKEKYLYDLSESESQEGINIVSDLNPLQKYSFIICQGVLEHVCCPNAIIEKFKKISDKNTYVYIEVPFDSPFYKSPFYNLQFLFSKYYKIHNILKHYIKTRKYKFLYPMAEHLNYFTIQSLEDLLIKSGYKIVSSRVEKVNNVWCREKIISILAQQ